MTQFQKPASPKMPLLGYHTCPLRLEVEENIHSSQVKKEGTSGVPQWVTWQIRLWALYRFARSCPGSLMNQSGPPAMISCVGKRIETYC